MIQKRRRYLLALAFGGVAMSLALQAHAQTVAADPMSPPPDAAQRGSSQVGGIADIIVTAQKRSERLQEVPISITAASGDQLKSLGITSPEQLEKAVPGFTVGKTLYGTPVFFLRGIGFNDTSLGISPAVSVYMDQLPMPFTVMARGATLDLERVEILKGPQGTLFGQNSTGGLVNYIAAKPTHDLKAGFDLTYGRFNQVDAEAFVSGPLSNTLSARLTVRNEYRGDWQKGYTADETLGRKDFQNGRLLVDWQPVSELKVELSATGWKDRSDSQQPQFVRFDPNVPAPFGYPPAYAIANFPSAPKNDRAAAWDAGRDLRMDNWYYQFGGRVDFDVADAVTLTSLTSYARYNQRVVTDFDSTTFPQTLNTDSGKIRSFAQELRLSGSTTGTRVKWILGANYQKSKTEERLVLDPFVATGSQVGPALFQSTAALSSQNIRSKAAFGSLDYSFIDTLTAQGSVRYTRDTRNFGGCEADTGDGSTAGVFSFLSTVFSGMPQTLAPGGCVTLSPAYLPLGLVKDSLEEDNISWRGGVNWKPNSDMLIYANISKGYKSGNFSLLPFIVSTQAQPVKQESVLAYETGTKFSGFSRKLQISAAAFYYDYRDKQLNGFISVPPLGVFPKLVSIPRSTIRGGEISATAIPMEGLTLSVSGTYVHSRIDSNPTNPTGAFGNTANFVGQSFANSPKWQGVLDAQYRFPVSDSLYAYFGTTVSARSSTPGGLRSGDPAFAAKDDLLTIRGYALLDLRAGLDMSGGAWRVEAFGRNVTNKFYIVGSAKNGDYVSRFTGMPATYGISAYFRY